MRNSSSNEKKAVFIVFLRKFHFSKNLWVKISRNFFRMFFRSKQAFFDFFTKIDSVDLLQCVSTFTTTFFANPCEISHVSPAQMCSIFEKYSPLSRDHSHQFLWVFIKFSSRTIFFLLKEVYEKWIVGVTTLIN